MSTLADLPSSAQILNGPSNAPEFAVDDAGKRWRLAFRVAWEDCAAFLQAVKGKTQQIGGIVRDVPLQCPYDNTLYAVAIQGRGQGADPSISPARPHPYFHFRVDFAALPYGVEGDSAYITLTHSGASQSVTIPGYKYKFAGNNWPIETCIGIPIGGVGIQLTVHQIPSLYAFMATAAPLVGKVNSSTFAVAGISYAAGTVLFDTFGTTSQKSILGTEQHEAQISLVFRQLPWNKAIRPDGVWDDVVPAPFDTADLGALIV